MMCIPFANCSYRVTGCQSLGPIELRALIDSELWMFGVLWATVCRAKIKRWQSARRCWRTLTWWGVGGRRGVDLRQGGVATAGASLLRGAALRKREREGGISHRQDIRCQRCKEVWKYLPCCYFLSSSAFTTLNCYGSFQSERNNMYNMPQTDSTISVSETEVVTLLRKLNSYKVAGPEGLVGMA